MISDRFLILATFLAILVCGQAAPAQMPSAVLKTSSRAVKKTVAASKKADQDLNRLITQLARQQLPHTYTDDKDWGEQAERWDGIQFRREGLRVETKRKKKSVNHGTWRRYTAKLVEPEKHFQVQVRNLSSRNGKMYFDLAVLASVELQGRQSKWLKGVQLYSISADAKAKLSLIVSCELDVDLDLSKLPPDVILKPRVSKAEIQIHDFKVDRVSKAGGEFAQQLTKAVRKKLEKKIEQKEIKITEKLNRSIARKSESLKFSFDSIRDSKMSRESRSLLAPHLQKALNAHDSAPEK